MRLRELAEAAETSMADDDAGDYPGITWQEAMGIPSAADARYIAAMSPDVTLALLAAVPGDPYVEDSCYRCGYNRKGHAPDCAWVKAREVMG